MDWQDATVVGIVASAVIYLFVHVFVRQGDDARCGGCGSCEKKSDEPDVVTLK